MGTEQTEEGEFNQYQKSALAIALRHLEKAVDAIAGLLASDQAAILYRTVTNLSADQVVLVQERLTLLRREIADVAATFDLPAEEENGQRRIVAQLSSAWEGLEDVRSKKLRRYGSVDPRLERSLDPHIDRLTQIVLELASIVADEQGTS